jgi:YVTN family beta-propeller protein
MFQTRPSVWLISVVVGIAADASAREFLYVHNTYSGEISKVAIPGHEVVGKIEIGFYMDYVNKSPDGRTLYVNRINGDLPGARARNVGVDGELIAIDTQTDEIAWRMKLDGMPHHMSVSKDGQRVFVPYYDTWWLAVVDVPKREVIKKIWIGHGGHGTKLSADGQRLYVGSMMNDLLTVIDTEKLEVIDAFPFRDGVRPFAFPADESVIYVQQSWLHGFIVLNPKTREQRTVNLPDLGREVPMPDTYPHNVNHGIALKPGEKELWVNGSALDTVFVYTHPGLELVATIPVGSDPNAMAFSKDGRYVYVSNRRSDDLSILDTTSYKEIKRLPLGKYPQRMVVIDVPE